MQITILNTSVTDKGKYKELDIAYKDNEGKTQGKKIMSFSQKDTFSILSNASSGESFEVKPVKNDKGYWDWTDVRKVEGTSSPLPQSGHSISSPRSTYETPEERFQKQIYIVRQSSISSALEYFDLTGNKKASLSDVLSVAKTFEDFVFNRVESTKKDAIEAIKEMGDDIPL